MNEFWGMVLNFKQCNANCGLVFESTQCNANCDLVFCTIHSVKQTVVWSLNSTLVCSVTQAEETMIC